MSLVPVNSPQLVSLLSCCIYRPVSSSTSSAYGNSRGMFSGDVCPFLCWLEVNTNITQIYFINLLCCCLVCRFNSIPCAQWHVKNTGWTQTRPSWHTGLFTPEARLYKCFQSKLESTETAACNPGVRGRGCEITLQSATVQFRSHIRMSLVERVCGGRRGCWLKLCLVFTLQRWVKSVHKRGWYN